jgi:ABC-2 type transport system ATP-binding protein
MIQAEHLSKKYRKTTAVNDVSFTVETGKVTGFLGPNGAGKSTTMRLMVGLDRGQGHTTFDGKTLYDYDKPAHVIGMLLEAKAYHPTRTALDHLRVLAAAGSIPETRAHEVLDIVGLKSVAGKRPGKFSLGMSQRLGIAAAILGQPKYLILDEPANGLDPEGMAWLRQFLKDYADQGNAVFVSSHLLSEVSLMADNVIVIGKGKLIANTPIDALISGNHHSGVFVRVADPAAFAKALKKHNIQFEEIPNGFKVTGQKTDDIGKLAFAAKVPVLELSAQKASLEEAFLELTAGSAEFKTQAGGTE